MKVLVPYVLHKIRSLEYGQQFDPFVGISYRECVIEMVNGRPMTSEKGVEATAGYNIKKQSPWVDY